jgi:ubiquinone/menaquinone biosynthesis C-methylase UbiE
MAAPASYLLSRRDAEHDRLRLQSRVWEPAGRALTADLDLPLGARVLDVGCGALGWLRVLAERVPDGVVVGTDVDPDLLAVAGEACDRAGYDHVRLVEDDLFHSSLPAGMFDLVHARFQLAPLGRPAEQLAAYRRLLKPGGILVVEEPDSRTWTYEPYARASASLIGRIAQAFRGAGGDLDAGRRLARHLENHLGLAPATRTHVLGLEADHPYLRLPLQLAASLEPQLRELLGADDLDDLLVAAAAEIDEPDRGGTTFTLVQSWARID